MGGRRQRINHIGRRRVPHALEPGECEPVDSAERLFLELRALDIRIFLDGERLRCSAPKGRLTKELEQRIATQKADLIRALHHSKPQPLPIGRRSARSVSSTPLSFAQERFWFLQSLAPESTDYNITACQRVFTTVDPIALEFAVRAVVKKHEILRTSFPELDGSPTQVVREELFPEVAIYNLDYLCPLERATAIESKIQESAKHKFDLAAESLMRIALIRVTEQEHLIVLTAHHIICDGWSIGIFFAELTSFYETHSRGRAVVPTQLPIQYGDYALWERDQQASGILAPQIDYWKSKLKGSPRSLEIPLDHVRSASFAYEGRLHRFQLSAATSESVRDLARQERATPFVALLTIFKALLFRYTKQRDIVVGTPVSTRTRFELEQLIGCFINTQVLRTEIPPGLSTREFLARVRATVLESLNNADVPFEILVSELITERDLSRSPLFQVAFILQNTPRSSDYDVVSGGTTFDLTLYMWNSSGVFGGCIEYNAKLFSPETIVCLAGCYETLALEMVSHPETAIERLSVVTAIQEMEWFEKHNGPLTRYPDLGIHEWVERQASETPDAIAVICGPEQLTYRDLRMRSNRLAHRLRAIGVGPDSLVALGLDRSADLIVAPLAVWKAGGTYVPLDPEHPSNRLAFMLEDSAASVLITESRLLDRLPQNVPNVICLDRERQNLEQESAQPVICSTTADNLAYVIYTSGSTGKPKGVEISHRSLVGFLTSMQREPGIVESDRLLAITTLSFDIAGLELFLPLVSGARVVIAPRADAFDGTALAALLDESGITIMQATPVTWRLLLESGWRGTPGLKILCGGEALTHDLAEQLVAAGTEVWNMYGPTETTIWSTVQRVTADDTCISIGRPIANTQVYVMDEYGRPVPPGVAGELYIGGNGLARGYLNREELTAERFVKSSVHSGKRLYRTGDLVRRLGHGGLEYLGRVDHQLKIRGFRIELGEIEAAIERQPEISQAVVVVREDRAGEQRLTAYMKATDRAVSDRKVLRKALLTLLPEYMVPAAFVQLDEFPLTPNLKVDRRALLEPKYRPSHKTDLALLESGSDEEDSSSPDKDPSQGRYVPPRNHVEFVMTEIWRDVLGLDKVGLFDNFFELGGHSLTAVRLISRLRSTLGMDLPLRCIFIDPTIAGLSSHISYDVSTRRYQYTSEIPRWNCLVPAQPKGTRTPLFFVAGYQNTDDTLLVLSRLIPNLGLDQPVFGFRPRWIEGGGDDYTTIKEMTGEFLTELRAVQPKGPYLLGGHCVGGIAALELAQLLIREGEEVRLMVLLDTERPSALRTFLTDLYFMRLRASHIVEVICEIIRPGERTRGQIIRDLVRRKFKISPPEQAVTTDRFHRSMVRYRRLLYSHAPEPYAGRITLIVNEEQARVDRDLGWKGAGQGGVVIHTIAGDHDTMLTHHGKEVAHVILNCIDEALAEPQPDLAEVCVR
jgi:amino acid adenylation domain-containing protein